MICQRSSSTKDKEKPEHTCFLNWNKASTSMEADGVVQGFSNSVEMHGLKYNCLIGKFKFKKFHTITFFIISYNYY